MNLKFKYFLTELFFEWSAKFFTLQTTVIAWIVFIIAKYFYFGSHHMQKYWHQSKFTSYQILEFIWDRQLSRLVMVLPIAIFLDILIKRIFPERILFRKKKSNQEAN